MNKTKTIEVHRYFNLVDMAQEDPEVKAWLGQSYRAIGPYFKDKATATGLSFAEQRMLLPELIGIEDTDKDFRKAVNKFFDEILTPVPKDGLKLNISLENDDQPLSNENKPIHPLDYIRYRHLIGHPDVGKDKNDAERNYIKRYYLVNPEGVSKDAVAINDLEDNAFVVYSKYKDDPIKVDQILTILGTKIKTLKHDEKVLLLKEYAKKQSKYNEHEQKAAFEKFVKTAEDKDLEYKYLIEEMIGAQFLQRVGNNIIYKESGEQIGESLQDAVLYFKNAKNSRALNLLKAEYRVKVKKGDSYLPGENPEPIKKSDKTE